MDLNILIWINENLHGSAGFSYFVKYLTYLGESGAVWIALCVVLLIFKRTRYAGLTLAIAMICDYLSVNLAVKNIVNRDRPWIAYPEFESFYESISLVKPSESSFPSGHSAISFCAAAVLVFRFKLKALPAVLLALLIALSRLYLCVHYPTDVLGGAVIGAVIGIVVCLLVDFVKKRIIKSRNR